MPKKKKQASHKMRNVFCLPTVSENAKVAQMYQLSLSVKSDPSLTFVFPESLANIAF